jgi:predicted RNase H-like HicB family nuclease
MDPAIQTLKEAIDTLKAAIDTLVEAGPLVPADGQSIKHLFGEFSRLESVVTEATASFEASGDWAPDGAKTAVAWVASQCRVPKSYARRTVHRGKELAHLPAFARAWSEGRISSAQVDTISSVRNDTTEEALARDEQVLCDQAATLSVERFTRAVAYWAQFADPDGTENAEDKRQASRDVYVEQSFQGLWLGKMTLDPISGAIVAGELARLEHDLFEADWAQAKEALGTDPTSADLARTPGQRRADALVEMATRSRSTPADARRPAPLFSVLVGYETLHGRVCELAQGTVIAPGALLPWLDEAYLERAVFTPANRVEVSETARLFTGATRRAIELRDRECTHPYCDGCRRCDVDHIVPYGEGGPTTQENGRLLCSFHNRLRTQRPPPSG